MYSFKESGIGFKKMLKEMTASNNIKKYNFVSYIPVNPGYEELDGKCHENDQIDKTPDTITAEIKVPSRYFKRIFLNNIETGLYNILMQQYNRYMSGTPQSDLIDKGTGIGVRFRFDAEMRTRYAIPRSSLGICSICVTEDDEWKHLKHIDFEISPITDDYDYETCHDRIMDELNIIDPGDGWIVDSGFSYHFHGRDILNRNEWFRFMENLYRQTEVKPTTLDTNWPRIQLENKGSVIRIGSRGHVKEPRIISEIRKK